MTSEQLNVIRVFHELNQKNCEDFSTNAYCEFVTLRNEANKDDQNIVIVATTIKELNENYVPITETKNIFVEPNGNHYEMDMMHEVFKNSNEMLGYIQSLTKFNWNEK